MRKKLFATLDVYHQGGAPSAAMNMAIDEALLECVAVPTIRFYRWLSPALSFGYFGRFADVAGYQHERDLVRRWTGGGVVLHGEDLTYSLVIPANHAAFHELSMSIYEKVHQALRDALSETGQRAIVAADPDRGDVTDVNAPGYSCFENPVRADVMIDGRKIAGAAQRRTRRGLLQQGSIQRIKLGKNLTEQFAQALAITWHEQKADEKVLNRARELTEQKYCTENWLRKR